MFKEMVDESGDADKIMFIVPGVSSVVPLVPNYCSVIEPLAPRTLVLF
jgi:hypothetical protein